jgi:eukaryotic-like serine/threonine-protein kinase
MPVSIGTRLGPYEILARIGRGGMGEVYKAHDPRVGRDVAIKISAERFTERFSREAHAIAALNHPNICTLYDVGPDYLVMELIEGPTLADRIKKGPLAIEEALEIARQIAAALDAAHEKNIVHRDLKPGNIKIKADGTVKVLDFGVAKMTQPDLPEADPEQSPTLTFHEGTRTGVIMGTAAYMAPEQARGKSVDRRADIWAFGVVLYEMLTGKQAFVGESITDVLAAIVKDEPDLTRTPIRVRRLLRSCLKKSPKERLQAIGDWQFLLDEGASGKPPRPARLPWVLAAAFALVALMTTMTTVAYLRRVPEQPRVSKLFLPPPEKTTFNDFGVTAVSPDGRHVAFTTTTGGVYKIWVRDLDSLAARALTEEDGGLSPFWSPDSRFIAFFTLNRLKKIAVGGGPPISLCDISSLGVGYFNGSWSKKDVILIQGARPGRLFRAPAGGGDITPVTTLDAASGEIGHAFPWFMPDGRHFLYTALKADPEKSAIYVADIDSKLDLKDRHLVLAANSSAVYAAGNILFLREGTLMAQPFDVRNYRASGDPTPIAEHVDYLATGPINHQGKFSSSQNGVLAYTPELRRILQLTWFDRSGKESGTVGDPGEMEWPTVSPDGSTVAVDRLDPKTGLYDLWLYDLKRGNASRLTSNAKTNDSPIWSPDSKQIVFSSTRDGIRNLYLKATDLAARDAALVKSSGDKYPLDWSSDGRYIVYLENIKHGDLWVAPLFGDRKPFPYLQTNFDESFLRLSPNGKWAAYESDETGQFEVYVQSFPAQGRKWRISSSGGDVPTWSRDGKELFFVAGNKLMVTEVDTGTQFEFGTPKPLFEPRNGFSRNTGGAWFDVSRDGRFLIRTPAEQSASVPMTLVINWTAGLRK